MSAINAKWRLNMSNQTNSVLYDRMADLLPYLTPMTADELDGYIKAGDLDSAHYLLKVLEASYAEDITDTPLGK